MMSEWSSEVCSTVENASILKIHRSMSSAAANMMMMYESQSDVCHDNISSNKTVVNVFLL